MPPKIAPKEGLRSTSKPPAKQSTAKKSAARPPIEKHKVRWFDEGYLDKPEGWDDEEEEEDNDEDGEITEELLTDVYEDLLNGICVEFYIEDLLVDQILSELILIESREIVEELCSEAIFDDINIKLIINLANDTLLIEMIASEIAEELLEEEIVASVSETISFRIVDDNIQFEIGFETCEDILEETIAELVQFISKKRMDIVSNILVESEMFYTNQCLNPSILPEVEAQINVEIFLLEESVKIFYMLVDYLVRKEVEAEMYAITAEILAKRAVDQAQKQLKATKEV